MFFFQVRRVGSACMRLSWLVVVVYAVLCWVLALVVLLCWVVVAAVFRCCCWLVFAGIGFVSGCTCLLVVVVGRFVSIAAVRR